MRLASRHGEYRRTGSVMGAVAAFGSHQLVSKGLEQLIQILEGYIFGFLRIISSSLSRLLILFSL
jgi:hypothetical protein